MALKAGDKAPNFKLFNSDKKEVELAALGKPAVLLFFPLAFTSVCTTELCSVRDNLAMYNVKGAEVFGISVDSPFTLGKFKAEQNLPFNLLSDFNKETSAAYDALYTDFVMGMKGVSKRAAFVVDAAGTIRYAEVLENAGQLPNLEAVQQAVAALN